jgi:iron complex transport system substrate-binding protein
MNRRSSFALPALVFLFVISTTSHAHAFSRIVSLKPNVTEILFVLGLGPQVVGVTNYCDRPEAARSLPKVADYIHVDAEKVLRLKPDQVVGSAENSSQKEVYFLMNRGIRVELFPFSTLEQTMASLTAMGKLLGREAEAEKIVGTMRSELENLQLAAQEQPRKKALFVVGIEPLVVAGSGNFLDEAAEYLGLVNVAGKSRLAYPTYSTESLIRSAPEVILELTMGSEKAGNSTEERRRWWRQFASLPAVKTGEIYFLDIEKMRAVPSLPQFLREIFNILHPRKS